MSLLNQNHPSAPSVEEISESIYSPVSDTPPPHNPDYVHPYPRISEPRGPYANTRYPREYTESTDNQRRVESLHNKLTASQKLAGIIAGSVAVGTCSSCCCCCGCCCNPLVMNGLLLLIPVCISVLWSLMWTENQATYRPMAHGDIALDAARMGASPSLINSGLRLARVLVPPQFQFIIDLLMKIFRP